MFASEIYVQRRSRLKKKVGKGLVLLYGNGESPMNYMDNAYPFRQDSSFLYYAGLDRPDLAVVIDTESGAEILFGQDDSPMHFLWSGPRPDIPALAASAGIGRSMTLAGLGSIIQKALAQGRRVHYLPPYRCAQTLMLHDLLGKSASEIGSGASPDLIRAVVAQRSIKSDAEIAEMEAAVNITGEMHALAMKMSRPGHTERDVVAAMAAVAHTQGVGMAYPSIFTVHGQILHNHSQDNVLCAGQLVVNDTGAESKSHYAGDITRTIPVDGRFSKRQREIYAIVQQAQETAIAAMAPGIPFRDIHRLAAQTITEGLTDLGLMRGDVSQAVSAGAHALFFPHGLGHMIGLDVHDMEALGEDHVGYGAGFSRSEQFGLVSLRLARPLEKGFAMTVEPGIYFIPALFHRWASEKRHAQFIDYEAVSPFLDFGGIRIEDNVVVTEAGCRILGAPIPKTIADIEARCGA